MTEVTSVSEKKFISLLGKNYPVIECNVTHNFDKPTAKVDSQSSSSTSIPQSESPSKTEISSMTDVHNANKEQETTPDVSENVEQTPGKSPEPSGLNESLKPSADPVVHTPESGNEIMPDILPSTDAPVDESIDIMDVVNMAAEIDESPANSGEGFEYQANTEVPDEDIYQASEENSDQNAENVTTNQSQTEPAASQADEPPRVDAVPPEEPSEESNQYPEAASEPVPGQMVSISGKMDILDYANAEWKGTTYKAQCLRKGYKMLIKATGCTFLRQARGDNYCALRATAFQVLTQNLVLFRDFAEWEDHLSTLVQRLKSQFDWITQWTFADRLQSNASNRLDVMEDCMSYFAQQLKISQAITNDVDRQLHFSALFNSGSTVEIKLFEALKLLLLDTAVQLHDANMKGEEVPVFAWLLFARDTSTDPKSLMLNHLNPAGKSGGLEQVEMCLLGQALQVTIRVVRPSNVEQEDFVTYYPDHKVNEWDKISLIAEDDRHYNIVVP
uniref:Uncharacterized protein LOC100177299 n=1 Tax=Phallusia mammillata TaxID=59560 RepID=A0A6F9DG40_9ASCI|nr:uncharacterized protein LOC100177299 [Phallusia mammillata]